MGTFTKLTDHVVYSTKYRRRSITNKIWGRIYGYIGVTVRILNGSLIEIEFDREYPFET